MRAAERFSRTAFLSGRNNKIVSRGERLYEPEIWRIAAREHFATGDTARAEDALRQAISTAHEIGATRWTARAQHDLAALGQKLDRDVDADALATADATPFSPNPTHLP